MSYFMNNFVNLVLICNEYRSITQLCNFLFVIVRKMVKALFYGRKKNKVQISIVVFMLFGFVASNLEVARYEIGFQVCGVIVVVVGDG